MLLTLISTYMQNIIWILLVHNRFLAANVCKYTVRYAVRLPINIFECCAQGLFFELSSKSGGVSDRLYIYPLCENFYFRHRHGVGVEGPSRGDPVKGWKMMGCSVRSDNLF